jgi:hypothetical protein
MTLKNIKAVLGILKLVVGRQAIGRVTNWDSNLGNWNATNGVYDNQGKRLEYQVPTPTGLINILNNNSNRIGYIPSK